MVTEKGKPKDVAVPLGMSEPVPAALGPESLAVGDSRHLVERNDIVDQDHALRRETDR